MEMGKISNKEQINTIVSDDDLPEADPIKKKLVKESNQLSSCDEASLKNELEKIKGEYEVLNHYSIYFQASLLSKILDF